MRLTKEAITELERNPYVIRSGPERITYSREFKHHFMCEYLAGRNRQKFLELRDLTLV